MSRDQELDELFRLDRARDAGTDPRRHAAIIEAALQRVSAPVEAIFEWRRLFTKSVGTSLAATALAGALAAALIVPRLAHRPREVPLVNALLASDMARLQDLL